MRLRFLSLLSLIGCFSLSPIRAAVTFPPDVVATLSLTGTHRVGLEALLRDYARRSPKKYKAACFLIAGSRLHRAFVPADASSAISALAEQSADAYVRMLSPRSDIELADKQVIKQLKDFADTWRAQMQPRLPAQVNFAQRHLASDATIIDSAFVRGWVEQTLRNYSHSPLARRLTNAQMFDYLLPYRSMGDYPFIYPISRYVTRYADLLHATETDSLALIVERLNRALRGMRRLLGSYPYDEHLGLDDLLFSGSSGCDDVAYYAANILRAAGVPCIVGTNAANRFFLSNHSFVAAFDRSGRPCTFNPESSLPAYRFRFDQSLNLLYHYFNVRQGNPATLRAEGEPIPRNLADPCIEDHTDWSSPTVSLTLPYTREDRRRVAYLATFRSDMGLVAVTWGEVDAKHRHVTFKHVVPDNLYFPVICTGGDSLRGFADPFMLRADSTAKGGYTMQPICPNGHPAINTWLKRKFPIKPAMHRLAHKAMGMRLIASNDYNFKKDVDTLWRCDDAPEIDWHDVALPAKRAYRHYRILPPTSDPHVRIAEMEWLVDSARHYANVMRPEPLVPGNFQNNEHSAQWQRLMHATPEEMLKLKISDGDVTTAPEFARNATIHLKQPQIIDRIRFCMKNAGNAVCYGDTYRLYEWRGGMWQHLWTRTAVAGQWRAAELAPGRLYWLHDQTQGTEEMPFIVDEHGNQQFLMQPFLYMIH